MHWSYQTPSSDNTREDYTHGHHQMVNTEFRSIIFFAAEDGENLYSHLLLRVGLRVGPHTLPLALSLRPDS